MNSLRKKRSKKLVIIAIAISFILASGAALAIYSSQSSNDPKAQDSASRSDSEQKEAALQKQEFLDNQEGAKEPDNEKPANTTKQEVSLEATLNGDDVIITTNLSSIPSGTCTLSIESSPNPVVKTAPVIYSPEHSSCAGFSVKKSEVNADTWVIALSVESSNNSTQRKVINFKP